MPTSEFAHKRIVITGGSSGLGLALARALAPRAASLVLIARDAAKLKAAAKRIDVGTEIRTIAGDLTDPAFVREAIATAGHRRPIDVLINNAGIMREGRFEHLREEDFREVIEVDFWPQSRPRKPHCRI